jgi:hypothetical protein|tara:strand:- start:6371 stop:6625 length:255 start_codon:yes stop_codon:yes gene_type:complete
MARHTNEQLYSEIKLVKQDICHVKDNQKKMQEDITMIKKTLLGPDSGTISRVNKNTAFRKSTGKVLWSIWVALLGIIGKIIFWN